MNESTKNLVLKLRLMTPDVCGQMNRYVLAFIFEKAADTIEDNELYIEELEEAAKQGHINHYL